MAYVDALFDEEGATAVPTGNGLFTGTGLCSKQFYETDLRHGFVGGWWWHGTVPLGPVAAAIGRPPMALVSDIPPHLEPTGPMPMARAVSWGRMHHAAFRERYQMTLSLLFLCHELPEEVNRVELHPDLTDEMGIPAPKLFYRRGENTEKLIAFAIERTKEVMMAAGAAKIVSTDRRDAAPGHYLGTARMGADPERSVVDRWGRAHDVKNLFIIDGSVFTTSGAVAPTSTIQAIGLRTADYIKHNLKQLLQT
jgi:choline dehydrogenase-like flavoprotein